MSMRPLVTHSLTAAALLLGLSLPPGDAQAASQILGIVASNGTATPLICGGGECGAHFSAFCLQEARPAPVAGQSYILAAGSGMMLIATSASGQATRLPAADYVKITSQIGFTSVHISVPQSVMTELGAATLQIEVGANVSVLPADVAGDVQPQTADEIRYATTVMREVAARRFDSRNASSDAARIASVFINALPLSGQENAQTRGDLWMAKANEPALANATPEGLALAEDMYRACQISVEARSSYSMRYCLELRHADLQATSNHAFWKDTAAY
ncbi:MAG: hypothetical protein ACKVOI_14640 [Dongiaceae bacterium]